MKLDYSPFSIPTLWDRVDRAPALRTWRAATSRGIKMTLARRQFQRILRYNVFVLSNEDLLQIKIYLFKRVINLISNFLLERRNYTL